MPPWVNNLLGIAAAIQGLWMLSESLWKRGELEPTRILDWGPQPNRMRKVTSSFVMALSSLLWGYELGFRGAGPVNGDVGYAVFMACMCLLLAIDAFSHLGVFESGMRVSTRIFIGTNSRFIPWSQIKHCQWTEQGTLTINPGWHQTTCLIPDDHIADVDAVLKAKCPEGELLV